MTSQVSHATYLKKKKMSKLAKITCLQQYDFVKISIHKNNRLQFMFRVICFEITGILFVACNFDWFNFFTLSDLENLEMFSESRSQLEEALTNMNNDSHPELKDRSVELLKILQNLKSSA